MKIPIQDLKRHNDLIAEHLVSACKTVIESGWFILGKEVTSFEEEFATFLQTNFCATNANGTDALELALRALEVKREDEVIIAANAGMYSSVATLAIGAKPIYVDIDPRCYSLDPLKIAAAITTRTKAVILTHLYGRAGHAEQIAEICQKAGIAMVEDCAEAHGCKIGSKFAGTFGQVGCFSFYPTKNLGALGDGGACITSDSQLYKKLRKLRQYGWDSRYHAIDSGGRNSRLDEIQAAVLRKKLPFLNSDNDKRIQIAEMYNEAFHRLPIRLPVIGQKSHVAHLYVIAAPDRARLQHVLKQNGVDTDIHFPTPDYRQPALVPQVGNEWHLSDTEQACKEVLTLPCFPGMTQLEIDHVIDSVQTAYAG